MSSLNRVYIKVNNDDEYFKLVEFSVAEGFIISEAMIDRAPKHIEWIVFNFDSEIYDPNWVTMYSSNKGLPKARRLDVLELVL